ncbi:GGDEF domain-containing protein [Metapseudomonas furukawaii]|uniref:diguanylate cyclase n=1 Tax=Metapseudomonas furukawaii TaxID=1149133 RepID=A0AAD1FH20_METFU|nr:MULTISPECIES: GGDEF domain-containing protein [Pseudomonas]ELS25230.1 diguanylate cyclase [Pseudomonas furukawaii]OWJ96314.1 GGDEF domain-containing protein [Pseudomonas sp. A46]BAU76076.1 diguanylate cyclase (GGDEF domain) with PAS/PAC sensor [Pseudomonas furukawaii]
MSQPPKPPSLLELYPEETREAAELLKQAVPHMVRHSIPPNPVHYALWYTYSKGMEPELNRRLDKITGDFDVFPPESAIKLFREYIIRGELEEARQGQQQVIELVDDIEGDVNRSVRGSESFQNSLAAGLAALHEPIIDDLPSVLNHLQESTQLMQEQQEQFLYRLRSAQSEIQHLRHQLERAQLAATLDGLTQVFNRHAFTRLLEQHLKGNRDGLALVMLDIDHFKQFNDQFGHPLGDRVLQHVGQLLRELLPPRAMAGRYGGEEFCVLLRDCKGLDVARAFAEQLRGKMQALRVKVRRTDQVLDTITASFGLALAEPGDTVESFITRADDALYQAKRNGRNQVHPPTSEPVLTA